MANAVKAPGGSAVNFVMGIWLIIAPFILSFIAQTALWNSIIIGAALLILAGIRMSQPLGSASISWLNAILGLWLIASPFVLAYATAAELWNSVIVGAIVFFAGSSSAVARPQSPGEPT